MSDRPSNVPQMHAGWVPTPNHNPPYIYAEWVPTSTFNVGCYCMYTYTLSNNPDTSPDEPPTPDSDFAVALTLRLYVGGVLWLGL